ncbi:MAG: hypothetical protein V3S48_00430 [Candidatus Neomarinimicrobiota bacterium]
MCDLCIDSASFSTNNKLSTTSLLTFGNQLFQLTEIIDNLWIALGVLCIN